MAQSSTADPGPATDEQAAPKSRARPDLDEIKAWVRREVDLAREGHSAETRAELNP